MTLDYKINFNTCDISWNREKDHNYAGIRYRDRNNHAYFPPKGHSLASLIATTVWKWNYFPLLVMVIFSLYLCEDSDDGH